MNNACCRACTLSATVEPYRFNRSNYVLKLVNLRESEQAAQAVRDAETRLLQHKRVVQDLEQRFRQVLHCVIIWMYIASATHPPNRPRSR